MNQPGTPVPGRLASAADDADRATLERIVGGDHGAIEILYERYKSMAYALALRITADAALAEDVVQDAFIGAWRNAARYQQGRGSVKTWLLSIVHHRAIDATRRRRPTTELPETDTPMPVPLTLPDIWAEVAGPLDREAVVVALGTLSDVQREAPRAGLLRRSHPAGDRRADRRTPRHRQEPHAAWAAGDASRADRGNGSVAGSDGTAPA